MKLSVGVWGGAETEAWLWAEAFRRGAGTCVSGVGAQDAALGLARADRWRIPGHAQLAQLLGDPAVDAVVLLDPDCEAGRSVLRARKPQLLPVCALGSPEALGRLCEQALASERAVGGLFPWHSLKPVGEVRSLLHKQAVGSPSAVRMRSLLAGEGGWDRHLNPGFKPAEVSPPLPPLVQLRHEALGKLALAEDLLGPIEEIACYGDVSRVPCSAVVTWKYRAPALYGSLELDVAPQFALRSGFEPRSDSVEITGSAGVIWMNAGRAQLRCEPGLKLFRLDSSVCYEHLESDWMQALQDCAEGATASLRNARVWAQLQNQLRRTVGTAEAVLEARNGHRRISVEA